MTVVVYIHICICKNTKQVWSKELLHVDNTNYLPKKSVHINVLFILLESTPVLNLFDV